MISSMPQECVLALCGIVLAGIFWRHTADRRQIRALQESANQVFRRTVITGPVLRIFKINSTKPAFH